MSSALPVILIELVLVGGGALAFGWWQLRDVKRAQAETRRRKALQAESTGEAASDEAPEIRPPPSTPTP